MSLYIRVLVGLVAFTVLGVDDKSSKMPLLLAYCIAVDRSTKSRGDENVFSSPNLPRLFEISRCGDLLGAGLGTRVGRFDPHPLISLKCGSHGPRTQGRLLGCLLMGRGLLCTCADLPNAALCSKIGHGGGVWKGER